MGNFIKCLTISLFIFIGYTSGRQRRLFKDFKVKQKEYSILSSNSTDQGNDFNIICQSAKCSYKSNTIYNVTSPDCGNYYTCQECPVSFGEDICYLGLTSDDWVNITEGHVVLSRHDRLLKEKKQDEPPEDIGYEDELDPDLDSFIEEGSSGILNDGLGSSFIQKFISSQTFTYQDHHDEKWLEDNKKQCQVDKDGNIELSFRLMFQYYRSPLEGHTGAPVTNVNPSYMSNSDSMPSRLQLDQKIENGGVSMLQFNLFKKKSEDDIDEMEDDEEGLISNLAKKSISASVDKGTKLKDKILNGVRFLYQKAQVAMSKPEVHIHFVVDDIRIKTCRQPLSWSGEMSSGSMIFVGNQNIKLKYDVLNMNFLKKSVRVNSSVQGTFELTFNSCLQVHCVKMVPTRLQYLVSPLSNRPPPNFNISRKFMGLLNRSVPPNGNPQYIVTPGQVGDLSGTSTPSEVKPHTLSTSTTPSSPPTATQSNVPQPPTAPANDTTPSTGPVTNIPGFGTPTQQNAEQLNTSVIGGLVQSEGNKTRFFVFMGVGILILILIIYFFFFRN